MAVEVMNVFLFLTLIGSMILGFTLIAEVKDPMELAMTKAWNSPSLRRDYWDSTCSTFHEEGTCKNFASAVKADPIAKYNVSASEVFSNENCTFGLVTTAAQNSSINITVMVSNTTEAACLACAEHCSEHMLRVLSQATVPALIGIWMAFGISLLAWIANNIILQYASLASLPLGCGHAGRQACLLAPPLTVCISHCVNDF